MRVVFFGTPVFAVPSLKALLQSDNEVVAVVTQPDRRKGRTRAPDASPVKALALEKGAQVFQPRTIQDLSFTKQLSELNPDVIVVIAYGKILPASVIHLPPYGCINIHASLLPKYRGAAPIQWALINGEQKTGITTMLMDEGLDTGPILLQRETDIEDDDTSETISRRLAEMGASLLMITLKGLKNGSLKPLPQQGSPSLAPPLRKEDGKIDWKKTAWEIVDFVRGMYPWPAAYCYLNNERIKMVKVKPLEGTGIAGRIENAERELIVGTGDGFISIIELQPEGKKKMTAESFLAGRHIQAGSFLQ
jgi:methionyl-tRNA formyltransferase